MNIINIKSRKSIAGIATVAILTFGYSLTSMASHTDIHISPAATGTVIQESNASTTALATFLPDLDLASSTSATMVANGTTTTTANYGVSVESATTTGDVHWQITVSHATEALTGGVSITEKGYFDNDGGTVADSPYSSSIVSGDIVFEGNTGWSVFDGDMFTNVDEIVFDADAHLGVYTVTRVLIDDATGLEIDAPFAFTIDLMAAADITPPSAPVLTFPTLPHSTSTSPITIGGTAEASSTVNATGGSSSASTTVSGSGNWFLSLFLNASSTNNIDLVAVDAAGNVSATTSFAITHFNLSTSTVATSSPIITLSGSASTSVFACNGYSEAGFSAVDSAGNPITTTSSLSISGTVGTEPGSYTLTYSATDDFGHTATTTRTVVVMPCSSGGGGGGGGNPNPVPPGLLIAVQNANPNSNVGDVLGAQIQGIPPGQVLGAAIFVFNNNLRVGSRGPDVIELQTRLTATGFYRGPITGYFGPLTKAAVIRFQAAHGLPQTGFVGPMTRAILNS